MQTRGILFAVISVVALLVGFWAYGTKLAADTRAQVEARQVPSPATGEDCAVYDVVAELEPALAKVPMADARFLKGEAPASAHAAFISGLDRQISQFLDASRCARVTGALEAPPAHWADWTALVEGRAALAREASAVGDHAGLWRLGHALQRELGTWRDGAELVERGGKGLVLALEGASPSTHDSAVAAVDELAAQAPDLHALLDHEVYAGELAAFDAAADGVLAGFSGLGLSQAVNVFHPVYDRYVALRAQPWAEREAALAAWQGEVDGYNHPIYGGLQREPILALERDAATHRATLEALRLAVRVARFARTYGACPQDLGRLDLDGLEAPLGPYALDGCAVVVGEVRVPSR